MPNTIIPSYDVDKILLKIAEETTEVVNYFNKVTDNDHMGINFMSVIPSKSHTMMALEMIEALQDMVNMYGDMMVQVFDAEYECFYNVESVSIEQENGINFIGLK